MDGHFSTLYSIPALSQEDTFAPSQEYNNAQLITFKEENYSGIFFGIDSFPMDTNMNMKYLHEHEYDCD